jgi:formate dehydrogenase iron-sulfur subunit
MEPPCKDTAESLGSKAIIQDEAIGAVIFNTKIKVSPANFKEIRASCPYDIPRYHEKMQVMAKCTMCFDRVKEGMLPACAKTCPTGAMNFGDRDAMLEMANKRLEELKSRYPDAMLANPDDVRVIFLLVDDPKKYHKFAVAENTIGITRKIALKRLFQPFNNFRHMIG